MEDDLNKFIGSHFSKGRSKFAPFRDEIFELKNRGYSIEGIAEFLIQMKNMKLVDSQTDRKKGDLKPNEFTQQSLAVWVSKNYKKYSAKQAKEVYIIQNGKEVKLSDSNKVEVEPVKPVKPAEPKAVQKSKLTPPGKRKVRLDGSSENESNSDAELSPLDRLMQAKQSDED